jgi:hypothetical protein
MLTRRLQTLLNNAVKQERQICVQLLEELQVAVDNAVAQEREACAKLVEEVGKDYHAEFASTLIAREIRKRSTLE